MITSEADTLEMVGTRKTKKYSSSIRLWHWANAIIITGSLLTVLVNSTILKPWTNAGFIADQLKDKGITISEDQARPVAFGLADKVWAIHIYFGYALVAFFIFRIVAELLGLADKTVIRKLRAAGRTFLPEKEAKADALNEKMVRLLYSLFYVMLGVMVVTGITLAMDNFVRGFRPPHFVREIHGFTMYLILGFIAVHLTGVFWGERKRHKGAVSDMINGGEAHKSS